MTYTPCANNIPAMNALKDCYSPAYAGLMVAGILIPKTSIASFVRGDTELTKNQVSNITMKMVGEESLKVSVVEAGGEVPWADTTEEFDEATGNFNKTVTFVTPQHGAGFSSSFVEPVLKNKDGYVVIMQRKDQNGDCAFPIIGLEKGAVGSTGILDYNDDATAGCYTLALVEELAPSAEMDFFDTDYETTIAKFNALLALAY